MTPPYTSDLALNKVKDLVSALLPYQSIIKLHIVDFTKTQQALYTDTDTRYGITMMRRAFVRIANRIAKDQKCLALVSGDSIAQVASQTLESLATIEHASFIPLLRPLLSFDKNEIIEVAKRIHTYSISILPYDDCCSLFAVNDPKTKPRIYFVEKEEEKVSDLNLLLEEAYANTKTQVITYVRKDYL
jgi:thiamine biosynthesis protein ThiI